MCIVCVTVVGTLVVASQIAPIEVVSAAPVTQKTLTSFSTNSLTLSKGQKSEIEMLVLDSPEGTKVICTGIRFESAPLSENIVVRKRAKAACDYAKKLNPSLSTWVQNKPTTSRNYSGRVLINLKPAVSAIVPPIVLPPTQLQKDLSLDESITKEKDLTDLQVCKTSDVTPRGGGSSNGFPRPATAFTGTLSARILIIPISFSDLRFSEEDYNRIKAATDKVTRFYETTSYRKVSVKYEFLPKQNWVNMTKSTVDYRLPENIPQRNNQQVVEDALALVDSSVNFNLYEGVAVLTGYSSTTRAGQGFPGMVFQTKNGTAKGVTLEVGSYSGNDTVMAHELGHSLFGLEDLYVFLNPTRPSVPDPTPAGPWDMMSNSTGEFFGWNKLLMGWLEPYHVRCITNQASSSHYIETIDTISSKSKLILINLSEGVTLAVEARAQSSKGVLVYKIDSRINHGDGPITAEKTLLGSGRQLTLDGWVIRVKDVDAKGFLIEVVKG